MYLQGRAELTTARVAFARALQIDEAVYGPNHPEVAIRVNNLGGVLRADGDLEGVQAAFERHWPSMNSTLASTTQIYVHMDQETMEATSL